MKGTNEAHGEANGCLIKPDNGVNEKGGVSQAEKSEHGSSGKGRTPIAAPIPTVAREREDRTT
jgi:hypothetical protein